jgi:hypothetical protein
MIEYLYEIRFVLSIRTIVFIGDINHRYTDINETCKKIKKY